MNKNNLLLRGCVLRNTEAVIGIVAYAGLSVCVVYMYCVCMCVHACICLCVVFTHHVHVLMCNSMCV